MNNQSGWFISGTDTGIGKTSFSCLLLRWLAAQGFRACGLKPIASGAIEQSGQLISEDALALQQASNIDITLTQLNPLCFAPPIAPHIAAEQVGLTLSTEYILQSCQNALQLPKDYLVIEGAGGLLVPLNEQETLLDLIRVFALPVILVVGMKLGCLNHALLTHQVLHQHRIPITGWVANFLPPPMQVPEENLTTLTHYMGQPLAIISNPLPDKLNLDSQRLNLDTRN